MANILTKGLMTTALISSTLMAYTNHAAEKPELFNHLPQDTLLVLHADNVQKEVEFYSKSQLYKELSEIEYIKIFEQLQKSGAGVKIDAKAYNEILSPKNIDLLMSLLDSSVSFALMKPDLEKIDISTSDLSEIIIKQLVKDSILQLKPTNTNAVNDLIKEIAALDQKIYSQTESNGYIVNRFKMDDEFSFYILEKSGVFTLTMNLEGTINLLSAPLNQNMNNLASVAPLYSSAHDSIGYINMNELYKMATDLDDSGEIKRTLGSISFIDSYLAYSDVNLKEQSETETYITTLKKEIPNYIKTLVKNNGIKSKMSRFFPSDTALFYNFTGLTLSDIVSYIAKQNGIPMKDLLDSSPEVGTVYNKLNLALGQDYAVNVSGVKSGMIPIPLVTIAVQVKSEKIIKDMIEEELNGLLKEQTITKLTKIENGTEITTLVSPVPGLTPAYMFHKGYLFISTDPTELIKIINVTPSNNLQGSTDFRKVTANKKALYQTTYINGEKLFGTLESVLSGLTPLIAKTPSDQIVYTKLIIPILKALKNIKTIGSISEATSEQEMKSVNKVYIK